jgi:hypothetical protein
VRWSDALRDVSAEVLQHSVVEGGVGVDLDLEGDRRLVIGAGLPAWALGHCLGRGEGISARGWLVLAMAESALEIPRIRCMPRPP